MKKYNIIESGDDFKIAKSPKRKPDHLSFYHLIELYCLKMLWNRIRKAFAIHNVRQCSLDWWDGLSCKEQLKIENDFFDSSETGKTTDIDIEVMYRTYIA